MFGNRVADRNGRVWVVTCSGSGPPLAYFSTREAAEAYVRLLVARYAEGKSLGLHGRPLAEDAGNWELGLGPSVAERPIDEPLEFLPGAWTAKVDESMRLVACTFTTEHRATKPAVHYRTGIHTICECYGPTPRDALDRARKAMTFYLRTNPTYR